ncbi:MAG: arylsulfatase [Verrucomicrobiae bacterium]|nr:arylsulfatase [Verrucomicrobiae bacterium]
MKNIFTVFAAIAFTFASHAQKQALPNIVFVFADDMGWGDAHVNQPAAQVQTPNIDKLAREGMRFTDAHCVGSLCAPSRFGLLTGRNPVIWKDYVDIESEAWNCMTMPQMLQRQGYYTACIGKWHFGVLFEGKDGRWGAPNSVSGRFPKPPENWLLTSETRLGPTDRGFNFFFGTPLQPGGGWFANMEGNKLLGNPKLNPDLPATEDFKIQEWMGVILGKSIEKIHELSKSDQPFFLYFPLNSPHKPIVPDEPFIGRSGIGKYGDYCQQVDWCLGEIMECIDAAEIRDNTILIFTSDNGSYYYLNSVNSSRDDNEELLKNHYLANGPFKKGKGQPEEGGHRIPYIVRWPEHIEAGAVNDMTISLGDHFATFAALTGYQLGQKEAIDSWNILPFWTGDKPDKNYQERTFFHYNNNPDVDAVRKGEWKMIPECYVKIRNRGKDNREPELVLVPGQLYDLKKDPGEQNNLWDQHPEVVSALSLELEQYRQRKSSAPHL